MEKIESILEFLSEIPEMMGNLGMDPARLDMVSKIRRIVYEWKDLKDLKEQGKLPCKTENETCGMDTDPSGENKEEGIYGSIDKTGRGRTGV